jgi:hypothetical protein
LSGAADGDGVPGDTVVLLHGLWMNGWDMSVLRHRLNKAGFNAQQFSYSSFNRTPRENAVELDKFVAALPRAGDGDTGALHYVAHSLGGLVLRHFFHAFPAQPRGRVVTLGTPHTGSSAARWLGEHGLGGGLLGESMNAGLFGDLPAWDGARALGSIAGTLRMGFGCIIPGIPQPSDGTVAVAETALVNMTDHRSIPVSHFGLLLSRLAAEQTSHFLTHGAFSNDE